MNIQTIKNHLHISVITSFIYTNTNNQLITTILWFKHHPKILPHVTQLCLKSRTTINTKIHPYALVHKIPPRNPAIWISLNFIHTSIISKQTKFFTWFTKTPYISENMTTPHEFTKNTGWGCADNKKYPRELFASPLNTHLHTSTLHRHPKWLKPNQELLFDLLPTVILTDI